MNTATSRLIRESFAGAGATMAATNTTLVLSFYARLFAAAPAVRSMFADDIVSQAEKLERTLDHVIASISDLEQMVDLLRDLGARHAAFGVREAHYTVLADVLTTTLAEEWGENWTDDHEAAWREILGFIAEKMTEGARGRPAA